MNRTRLSEWNGTEREKRSRNLARPSLVVGREKTSLSVELQPTDDGWVSVTNLHSQSVIGQTSQREKTQRKNIFFSERKVERKVAGEIAFPATKNPHILSLINDISEYGGNYFSNCFLQIRLYPLSVTFFHVFSSFFSSIRLLLDLFYCPVSAEKTSSFSWGFLYHHRRRRFGWRFPWWALCTFLPQPFMRLQSSKVQKRGFLVRKNENFFFYFM